MVHFHKLLHSKSIKPGH